MIEQCAFQVLSADHPHILIMNIPWLREFFLVFLVVLQIVHFLLHRINKIEKKRGSHGGVEISNTSATARSSSI